MKQPDHPSAAQIERMRRDYTLHGFDIADAAEDPVEQFNRWFGDATANSPGAWFEANAMTLATVGADGTITSRVVLLKGFDRGGPLFFTNYDSEKGRQLAEHPRASLCFYWAHLERQIRIDGSVETVPPEISDRYFQSRPRGSQLGAHASAQSVVVPDRQFLERRMTELEAMYQDTPIPRPERWGGYRIEPERFEYWQGRQNRLHDRIVYRRGGPASDWIRQRLSP